MLQARTLLTTTHDLIYVFDEVFTLPEAAGYRRWLEHTNYRFSIPGDDIIEHRTSRALSCFLDDEQQKQLGLLDSPSYAQLAGILGDRKIRRMWCNLTTYMTDCHYHVDGYKKGEMTLMYYANTVWHQEWGGETIFCNQDGEPELVVACKPNRAVLFPSGLYHRVSNLSTSAPPHRFVIVIVYTALNTESNCN